MEKELVLKIFEDEIKELLKEVPNCCKNCGLTYRHCSGFCDDDHYMFNSSINSEIDRINRMKKKLLEVVAETNPPASRRLKEGAND